MSVQIEVGKSYRDTAGRRVIIEYRSPNVTPGCRSFIGVVHGCERFAVVYSADGEAAAHPNIVFPWVEPRPTIAPGWWECRDGLKRYVVGRIPDELGAERRWIGVDPDNGFVMRWTDDGQYCIGYEFEWDLIRPTTPPVKQ